MKMSKLAVGFGCSVALLSSFAMAKEPVKQAPKAETEKSTLSGTSTKPKNLEWDLRSR